MVICQIKFCYYFIFLVSTKLNSRQVYDLSASAKLNSRQIYNFSASAKLNSAKSTKLLLDYCKKIADEFGIKIGHVKKLIPNLGNKTDYVLHYRNLQLYLSLVMKLTKTVLKFKQSDWMKIYIDFNIKKRKNAANSFEKNFFKLMINIVYSKTMENLRKRINVRLVDNGKEFLKYTSKPTHYS